MVTIGTDVATSRAAIELASREADVWAAVGIHPHDAAEADDTAFAEIARLAREPRVVAVGEIGLDFFRNLSPREAQERVFRRLLALGREVGKPVLIHCREAHEDVLRLLGEGRVGEIGGIMHFFSGGPGRARRCLGPAPFISPAGTAGLPAPPPAPHLARP